MIPLRPQYEFTPEENETLADLALWSGALGVLKLLQAGMGFLGRNVLGGLIELAVALSLLGARKSLRAAVDTAGNDIDHLMITIDKIATVFKIRLILFLVGAVLVTLGVLIVAVVLRRGGSLDGFL
jgi:hypothetical protein